MSAATVYAELAGKRSSLLDKLRTNGDLASVAMGLLARLIYVAEIEKCVPVKGITIGEIAVEEDTFKAQVVFNKISIAGSGIWNPKRSFSDYVALKAGKMAQAMADNPYLGRFFEDLVEHLDAWARHKGIRFADLEMSKHIITKTDMIVLQVGKRKNDLHAALA